MNLSEICTHIYTVGIFTWESNFYRSWYPSLSAHPSSPLGQYNAYVSQAAKGAREDQDTLLNVFERVESFLQRLKKYKNVPPTKEMMDKITRIMVELLTILGIATVKSEEINQGRMSEYFSTRRSPLAERFSEKYVKKLIGRTDSDMEGALKSLDKLTNEAALEAKAKVARATYTLTHSFAHGQHYMGWG
jgi:hypothetical protein